MVLWHSGVYVIKTKIDACKIKIDTYIYSIGAIKEKQSSIKESEMYILSTLFNVCRENSPEV